MKRREFMQAAGGGAVVAACAAISGCSARKEYDLLIKGGTVFDGTGSPGFEADVGILGDRIVNMAPGLSERAAALVIDARGHAVAPGFIDPHTHTDVELIVNPKAESKIRQGVTTEMGGNCGNSQFPLNDSMFEETGEYLRKEFDLDLDWKDMEGFFSRLKKRGIANNHATMLGQGALRNFVMGPYDRPPEAEELDHMKRLVGEHMEAGAFGLSTGLEYMPGGFAGTDELIELCREVGRYGRVHATHMRNEGDSLLESIEETVRICREAKVSTEIAHLKAARPRNWSKIDAMFAAIEAAQNEGLPLLADRYPYHAWSTGLSFHFPKWALEGTTEDFVRRLKDPSLWSKLEAHIRSEGEAMGSWRNVVISSVLHTKNRSLEGTSILDGAAAAGKTTFAFMRDLLIEEEGYVGMVGFGMSEDNLRRVLAHPLVMVGSDGNAAAPYGTLGKGKPHPRYYGTFPRVLGKFVREEKIITLAEAVKKMTSMPAEKFKISDRGRISSGYFADIVVFNPDTVIDRATFVDPHQYPAGIPYVIVNGQVVIKEGEHAGALPGKILRAQS